MSTCTCILAQINNATAFQAKLFTVLTHHALVSIEKQFQVRVNWKMFFSYQWDSGLRRVQLSLDQLDPHNIKWMIFSVLDSDSWQFRSLYPLILGASGWTFLPKGRQGTAASPWVLCWEGVPPLCGSSVSIFWHRCPKNKGWGVYGCLAPILTTAFGILLGFALSSQMAFHFPQ